MDIEILYWYWFVVGLVLVIAEIFIPSFTILWFGVGAILVGISMLLFDLQIGMQILLWTIFSVISTVIWFKVMKPFIATRKRQPKFLRSAIGETGVVTKIPAGQTFGRVRFSTPVLDKDEWSFVFDGEVKLGESLEIKEVLNDHLVMKK